MERTQEERKAIAATILQQLGGNMFIAMTGANSFMAHDSGLSFRLPASPYNKARINRVQIDLTPADTYTVEFQRVNVSKREVIPVSRHDDIYCDVLRDVFTRATGLYTTLTRN